MALALHGLQGLCFMVFILHGLQGLCFMLFILHGLQGLCFIALALHGLQGLCFMALALHGFALSPPIIPEPIEPMDEHPAKVNIAIKAKTPNILFILLSFK